MTAGEAIRLSAAGAPADDTESDDVLKRLQESVLDLLAGLDRAPQSLRVRAEDVEIELQWPSPVAPTVAVAAPAPAATHVGAVGPVVLASVPNVPDAPEVAGDPVLRYVTAQSVGVFYRAPEPGAKPFVDAGDVIEPGTQIGIIEAMKLMMAVESEVSGRVVEVLVADGSSVEYGDRLLAYEPDA